jgi:NADPH:quinone reductase-like Zn-dependent oxidoreductase
MGAQYLPRNVSALATEGRLVIIGMQGGVRGELNIAELLRKRGAVIATSLRARPAAGKAAICAAVREHVWPLVADGSIKPVIRQEFALEDVAEAHRLMDAGTHAGKILLRTQAVGLPA